MEPYYQEDGQTIYHGDCREILPTLGKVDLVLTDPPYGMKKAKWDMVIPDWIPYVERLEHTAFVVFCGVIGMRDYPTPDWVGAWVRIGSTQRIGIGIEIEEKYCEIAANRLRQKVLDF